MAYASSFDQIGPLTNNIEDTTLVLEVIAGIDKNDSTSSSRKVDNYTCFKTKEKRKIAVLSDCLESDGLDNEIKKSIEQTIEKLKQEGHELDYVSFPYLDFLVPTYYVLTTDEASSNLARFDGVHYGYRTETLKI